MFFLRHMYAVITAYRFGALKNTAYKNQDSNLSQLEFDNFSLRKHTKVKDFGKRAQNTQKFPLRGAKRGLLI